MTVMGGHPLVKTADYPIGEPATARYRAVVEECRGAMARSGCAVLPGFVDPQTARAMADELADIATFNRCRVVSA